MYFKIVHLVILSLYSSFNMVNADEFVIKKDGLYSKAGLILNREVTSIPITYMYTLNNISKNKFTLYRETFLNSSKEQCATTFNMTNDIYVANYLICYDEIVSISEHKNKPAIRVTSYGTLPIYDYGDDNLFLSNYSSENISVDDVVIFNKIDTYNLPSKNKTRNIVCNYYSSDYKNILDIDKIRCYKKIKVKEKAYLYENPNINSKTPKYLIAGDEITPLDESKDHFGNKWIYFHYKNKKSIVMWVNQSSVDLVERAQ